MREKPDNKKHDYLSSNTLLLLWISISEDVFLVVVSKKVVQLSLTSPTSSDSLTSNTPLAIANVATSGSIKQASIRPGLEVSFKKGDSSQIDSNIFVDQTQPSRTKASRTDCYTTLQTSVILPASYHRTKYAVDIGLSVLMLLLFSPIMLLVMGIIALDGGAPVYRHYRVGQYGRQFPCLKFRTMVRRSKEMLQEHLANNPDAKAEWAAERKLKNDPRITKLGCFLRKTSLDELPQLFNVIRGEMSLVGPRPVITDELELYGKDLPYYLAVKPGITGLWQVSGRNDLSYGERVALDKDYVQTWSLGQDFKILAKTSTVFVSTKGCY